jgi:hypothetical protein
LNTSIDILREGKEALEDERDLLEAEVNRLRSSTMNHSRLKGEGK